MAVEIISTKLHERMLLDVRIEPGTVRIPSGRRPDRATAPGFYVCDGGVCVCMDWDGF